MITNLNGALAKHQNYQGRRYLVAPMVMLTEGVHAGSKGPLLYREEDLRNSVTAWNFKPVLIRHPGSGCGGCDAAILEKQQVGVVRNTEYADGKLKAEAWLDVERLQKLAPEVATALRNGRTVEISTGLFSDNLPESGSWNGEVYEAVATNHQPDHLALLPDQIGACSIDKGCGLLRNTMENASMNTDENSLPLPTMNFGPNEATTNAGDALPLPTSCPLTNATHATPAGCGCAEQGLPLPTMNFGPNEATTNAEDVLPLPSPSCGRTAT